MTAGCAAGRNGASQPPATNPAKADRLPPTSINPDRYPPGMGPSQRGSKNESSAAGAKSPQGSVESNQLLPQRAAPTVQPQPTSPAEERPAAMPAAGAVAASSSPSAPAMSPSPAPTPAASVPVAYPVYPQMAGYVPHAGYAPPNGYAPPYGYPPGSVPGAGDAPTAMPYAAPPSPPPPTACARGARGAQCLCGIDRSDGTRRHSEGNAGRSDSLGDCRRDGCYVVSCRWDRQACRAERHGTSCPQRVAGRDR